MLNIMPRCRFISDRHLGKGIAHIVMQPTVSPALRIVNLDVLHRGPIVRLSIVFRGGNQKRLLA
jgi:hypothetical protein